MKSEEITEEIKIEKLERMQPIEFSIGEKIVHKVFGEGTVCESDGGYISVEFAVGKKKFLNPEETEGSLPDFVVS
jgi:hypothetical protein